MAELTLLEQSLADAWGLALAAAGVTELVEERTHDVTLLLALRRMRADAREAQARCHGVAARQPDEIADELRARAQHAKNRASESALPWFRAGSGPVEAWIFLAMAEAGEVAAWSAVARLCRRQAGPGLRRLAGDAVALERRHLRWALDGIERLTGLAGRAEAPPAAVS